MNILFRTCTVPRKGCVLQQLTDHSMTLHKFLTLSAIFAGLMLATPSGALAGDQEGEGTIATFWPLFDYRESPKEEFSNLSLLGPLIKIQHKGPDRQIAVRPFFYQVHDGKRPITTTDYLYPLVSTVDAADESSIQAVRGLFGRHVDRKNEEGERVEDTMFFPFYISGTSPTYGPYRSIFPFYGDIYERYWRDEYHYVLFPLYGRTVNKGTTTTNYLYPFFATIKGDRETGFQFWPLYGESAKEGSYRRHFALWPLFHWEESGLDTDNPTTKQQFLPFYARTDSPKETIRSYLWPFFGYRTTSAGEEERDYFWPFWVTVKGGERQVTRFIPFYAEDRGEEIKKWWYLWPVYRRDVIESSFFRQERDRVLYFLYSDNVERWPKAGEDRRRTALWPFFVYERDVRGVRSLGIPAPVEPILPQEGIEKNWAPFWRLYQQRWNDQGDSAVSFLWNLYWHETRGDAAAYELSPLLFYRDEQAVTELAFLKGLVRYRNRGGDKSLTFFWLPFGPRWGAAEKGTDGIPVAGAAGRGVDDHD